MEQLLLESSIDGFMGGRSLEGEQNNGRGHPTDWEIDIEAPRVDTLGQTAP